MQEKNEPGRFVSAAEMATLCGVHRATVGRWASTGRIVSAKLPDGTLVIPVAEAERIKAERSLRVH